jgi:hypothetical protein
VLRFLHGYWLGLARDGDLPPVRAVDPVDMREALGYVLLLDVQPDGTDFVYRLYGSGVAATGGQDWTGWSVGAMGARTKTSYDRFYRSVYRASLLARKPIYTEHRAPDFQSARAWQRLVLPLAGPGGTVARFLVGNVPVGVRPLTAEQSAELVRRVGPGP